MERISVDYLVIGAGLAGLYSAIKLSEKGSVLVVTKSHKQISNSYLAQGGIAAVYSDEDKHEFHVNDTLKAGVGICNKNAVEFLVENGSREVKKLISIGMNFDTQDGNISLGLEGGHCKRRVLHAQGNSTGMALVEFLNSEILKKENISLIEKTYIDKLIVKNNRAFGAVAFSESDLKTFTINSKYTIIASGGYAGIFSRSTNPNETSGEGIMLAYNEGAELSDMEFVQFHPTAFYSETGSTFLVSEAVRGEGAHLLNQNKERFMLNKHELAELAPRDIVAKEIFDQITKSDKNFVYLDLRHLDSERINKRFPNIYEKCKNYNLELTKDLIPVAPAAHFSIGGIKTNLTGETSIKNLFSCGEAADVHIHGANRLASNSLLSCLVFSNAISEATEPSSIKNETMETSCKLFSDENELKKTNRIRCRILEQMTTQIGIVRSELSLKKMINFLGEIEGEHKFVQNEISNNRLRSLIKLCNLIVNSALLRKESRGVHKRLDFPFAEENFIGHFDVSKNDGITFLKN